jgi:hypothetical protein
MLPGVAGGVAQKWCDGDQSDFVANRFGGGMVAT